MLSKSPPPLPSRTPAYQNQYHSALGVTVAYPNFWSRHHPIEDDGLCHLLYQYLQKSLKGCEQKLSSIYLPETVVFEHNFPRAWYYYDEDNETISKRPSRMLDVQSMYRLFGSPIKHVDVVAQFFYATVPVAEAWDSILSRRAKKQSESYLSQGLTYVEFFTVEGLRHFLLQQHRKPDGVLQRFVLPKGNGSSRKNSQMQVLWTPLMTTVYKRTNYYRLDDHVVAIPARLSTYDGPVYYSYESMVADDTKVCLASLCEDIVQHFYRIEKKQITRMVLYFKVDDNDRLWLLWCSSVRVQPDSLNPSTLRVPPALDQRTEVLNDNGSTVARLQARRHRQKHLLELDYHLFEATRDIEFALNINASHRRQAKALGMRGMARGPADESHPTTTKPIPSSNNNSHNNTPHKPKHLKPGTKGGMGPCGDSSHPLYASIACLCEAADDPWAASFWGRGRQDPAGEGIAATTPPGRVGGAATADLAGDNPNPSAESEKEEGRLDQTTEARDMVREELIALAMDAWYALYSTTLSTTTTTTVGSPMTRVVLAEPLVVALNAEELHTLVELLGLRPINAAAASATTQHYEVSPLLVDPVRRLDRPSLQIEADVTKFFKTLFDHRGEEIAEVCMDQFSEYF